jgi:uncharacterized metal-binding protein YceD (DUF177 family)
MARERDFPSLEVNVKVLPSSGYPVTLRPDGAVRQALAGEIGVAAVHLLECDLVFKRWRRDGVELSGAMRARIEQPCVVTLEPVMQQIAENIRMTFIAHKSALSVPAGRSDREMILDPEGDDPPDEFSGDTIDVWPVVAEMLMLAIDPFPRAPGAVFHSSETDEQNAGEAEKPSPFAALSALKKPENN